MKNIFLLPTEQNSWLCLKDGELVNANDGGCMLGYDPPRWLTQHLYITSDEDTKEGDWVLFAFNDITEIVKVAAINNNAFESKKGFGYGLEYCKKIILTTDPTLIADDVQSIDDEFLKVFVKNPTCKFFATKLTHEEPKQETLEKVTERSYSEEEVLELLTKAHFVEQNIVDWFEQFKKK
jgi:hypothetical protein